jgi:hypothetical protein
MAGLEDDLLIGLAENKEQKLTTFSKNLVKHPKKFIHENIGRKLGYLPLNRIVAIRHAIATGLLKLPFALIHADMILRRPIELTEEDKSCGVIINNFEPVYNIEINEIINEITPRLKSASLERSFDYKDLPEIPFVSFPIIFNENMGYISDALFSKIQIDETEIFERRGGEFPCEKAAWLQSLTESFQYFHSRGKFMAGPIMYDEDNLNFIHYSQGIPPVFHKKYYEYKDNFYLTGADPYQVIMDSGSTINAQYVKDVIKSYKKSSSRS